MNDKMVTIIDKYSEIKAEDVGSLNFGAYFLEAAAS